jgi:hypothetical protein
LIGYRFPDNDTALIPITGSLIISDFFSRQRGRRATSLEYNLELRVIFSLKLINLEVAFCDRKNTNSSFVSLVRAKHFEDKMLRPYGA